MSESISHSNNEVSQAGYILPNHFNLLNCKRVLPEICTAWVCLTFSAFFFFFTFIFFLHLSFSPLRPPPQPLRLKETFFLDSICAFGQSKWLNWQNTKNRKGQSNAKSITLTKEINFLLLFILCVAYLGSMTTREKPNNVSTSFIMESKFHQRSLIDVKQ